MGRDFDGVFAVEAGRQSAYAILALEFRVSCACCGAGEGRASSSKARKTRRQYSAGPSRLTLGNPEIWEKLTRRGELTRQVYYLRGNNPISCADFFP